MAANNQHTLEYWSDSGPDFSTDDESRASLQTDDGQDHLPEKILAESKPTVGIELTWYLVKWQNCPLLRSSWEGLSFTKEFPSIFKEWEIEKQRQEEGKSQALDITAFNKQVLDLETAVRQKRFLRRLKRRVSRVLSIVTND